MAQIIYRVSGEDGNGKRISRTFRNTDDEPRGTDLRAKFTLRAITFTVLRVTVPKPAVHHVPPNLSWH